eukprot:TRINITY_DN2403_c0_g1_i3.p2 TRINITY_DN2403_c0_g1~~TRINITY_DN2403_c0_g1_i3.p2  ORF type:complete len:286 (-),score=53.25 TRINITY_DN2403_c0_g1_i3:945-1802(-)
MGHVSTLTRFLCRPGSRTAAAVAAAVPPSDGPPVLPKSKGAVAPLPTEIGMGGRFLYDEVNRTLLLRTILGGNPIWMSWAFGSDGEPSASTASSSESGANVATAGSTDDVDGGSEAGAAAAVASSAAALGFASAGRVRSITMYFPGQELTAEGVATHIMMSDDVVMPRGWTPSHGVPAGDACGGGDVEMGARRRGSHRQRGGRRRRRPLIAARAAVWPWRRRQVAGHPQRQLHRILRVWCGVDGFGRLGEVGWHGCVGGAGGSAASDRPPPPTRGGGRAAVGAAS